MKIKKLFVLQLSHAAAHFSRYRPVLSTAVTAISVAVIAGTLIIISLLAWNDH